MTASRGLSLAVDATLFECRELAITQVASEVSKTASRGRQRPAMAEKLKPLKVQTILTTSLALD